MVNFSETQSIESKWEALERLQVMQASFDERTSDAIKTGYARAADDLADELNEAFRNDSIVEYYRALGEPLLQAQSQLAELDTLSSSSEFSKLGRQEMAEQLEQSSFRIAYLASFLIKTTPSSSYSIEQPGDSVGIGNQANSETSLDRDKPKSIKQIVHQQLIGAQTRTLTSLTRSVYGRGYTPQEQARLKRYLSVMKSQVMRDDEGQTYIVEKSTNSKKREQYKIRYINETEVSQRKHNRTHTRNERQPMTDDIFYLELDGQGNLNEEGKKVRGYTALAIQALHDAQGEALTLRELANVIYASTDLPEKRKVIRARMLLTRILEKAAKDDGVSIRGNLMKYAYHGNKQHDGNSTYALRLIEPENKPEIEQTEMTIGKDASSQEHEAVDCKSTYDAIDSTLLLIRGVGIKKASSSYEQITETLPRLSYATLLRLQEPSTSKDHDSGNSNSRAIIDPSRFKQMTDGRKSRMTVEEIILWQLASTNSFEFVEGNLRQLEELIAKRIAILDRPKYSHRGSRH